MATHPLRPGERGTLANALVGHFPELSTVGDRPTEPGLVHRLDTGTSGLLIVARTDWAFSVLRARIRQGSVHKEYEALCEGEVRPGEITGDPVVDRQDRRRMRIEDSDGAEARTTVRSVVLGTLGGQRVSLVTAVAPVAKRHQVRVHLAHAGHPLIGDTLYGGPAHDDYPFHALRATRVAFDHPDGGERIEVSTEGLATPGFVPDRR
ncbi:MAG: RNA pseudouridine synthase [Myxococcales bacterium]|nr:RNA pseudouridine synthase [Myxococcales bacterium]